jgi:hypothetical protein
MLLPESELDMVEISDNGKKIVNDNETLFTKIRQNTYSIALVKVMAARKVKRNKKKLSFIVVFIVLEIFFFSTFQFVW